MNTLCYLKECEYETGDRNNNMYHADAEKSIYFGEQQLCRCRGKCRRGAAPASDDWGGRGVEGVSLIAA